MTRNRILPYLGLALVTVIPATLALALTAFNPSARDGLGGFTPVFLGFLTVIVVSFGWLFLVPSVLIAIWCLTKRDHVMTNALTLAVAAVWLALYWIATNFR